MVLGVRVLAFWGGDSGFKDLGFGVLGLGFWILGI